MHTYLVNTRFAAETLFQGIFQETLDLAQLQKELATADRQSAALESGAADFLRSVDQFDDEGIVQLRAAEAWDARAGRSPQ